MFSGRLSWRKLRVLITHLPADSPYGRAVLGDDHIWTLDAQLLAAIHDRLAAANWQRAGGKGQRPKPIPRPGTRPEVKKYGGGTPFTQAQVLDLLARVGPQRRPAPNDAS